MSVLDNVKAGLHNHTNYTAIEGALRLPRYFKEEKRITAKALELLKVFELDGEAQQLAANLPYGKQRKLEIARALATDPKLLLLDEPAAGMNPNETAELMNTIHFVRDEFKMTIPCSTSVRSWHRARPLRCSTTRRSSPHISENKEETLMSMLSIKDLQVYYGAINAIKGISFDVEQGEIIALIGANGAGKTTILHTITGLVQAKHGSVMFGGKDLTKTPAHKIVSMGMAHVPEGRRVFAQLSVLENLMLGAYTRKDKTEIQESLKHVFKRFPRLEERRGQMAGTLSGGEQQMLAMGRALMSKPSIILMDEPSMGLSPLYVSEIFDIIQEINKSGTTVLLVEQNAKKALSIANRAYVLETGKIVLSGDAHELMNNDSVKKAYLGE